MSPNKRVCHAISRIDMNLVSASFYPGHAATNICLFDYQLCNTNPVPRNVVGPNCIQTVSKIPIEQLDGLNDMKVVVDMIYM